MDVVEVVKTLATDIDVATVGGLQSAPSGIYLASTPADSAF